MKKKNLLIILFFYTSALIFTPGTQLAEEPKNLKAESIPELILLIKDSIRESEKQRFEDIKKNNQNLVKNNLSEIQQYCSAILHTSIEFELQAKTDYSVISFLTSVALAEMYFHVSENRFLINKCKLFGNWKKADKLKYLEGDELFSQGQKLLGSDKTGEAIQCFEKSKALFQLISYREGEAESLESLGYLLCILENYDKGLAYHEQALGIYRELDSRLGVASSFYNLGDVYFVNADYKNARFYYEQALVIYSEINDSTGVADSRQQIRALNRSEKKAPVSWIE